MNTEPIPQTDPRASYLAQRAEIDAAVARVLAGGHYILGEEVERFEAEFAAYIGAEHAVGVASGTDAIILALRAVGVGAGDYVVTVSHTAVATVAAVELAEAKPLLIDIDPVTYTMDPAELARVLERPPGRIGAILPVHLYGQAADLTAILPLGERFGIPVVEDCAQSHGATLGGRRLGAFGAASAFSFYPTKNLGGFGDGGAVVTRDGAVAERLRSLRQYGWRERYISDIRGMNSRLDELQAAILWVKLGGLDRANGRRRAIAEAYDRGLAGLELTLPARRAGAEPVFHQYVVRSSRREELRRRLAEEAIGTGIHYPVPVHLQPAYRGRFASGPGGLSQSEFAAYQILSLPLYPELGAAALDRVIAAIGRIMSQPA